MVPLPDGAEVLGPAAFAEGLQDGGDGGGALGGQVAPDPPRPVHGRLEAQVPVAEPAPAGVVVGVGLLGAPRLVGGLRDEPEVVEVRPGGRGVDEDLVRLGLELVVVDPAGPGGDLPRPGDGEAAGGGGGVEVGVAGEQAHVADGGPGVPGAEVVFGGEPGGAAGVPVGVVVVAGVEPAQEPVGGGAEQGGDRPECLQRLAAGGSLEVGGGRGVQVRAEGLADPQRVGDAGEPPAGAAGAPPGRPGRIRPRLACTSSTTPSPLGCCAAAGVLGGHRGCAWRLTRAGCLPLPTEYPFDLMVIKLILHDLLFDSCRLRHRQVIVGLDGVSRDRSIKRG